MFSICKLRLTFVRADFLGADVFREGIGSEVFFVCSDLTLHNEQLKIFTMC